MRTRTLLLSVILLVTGSGLAWAGSPAGSGQMYRVNFVDVEITTLAEAVATATGKQMVLHPQVHGLVTLTSEKPLTAPQLYAAFAQTVVVKGYVVDETRGVVKVYPGRAQN